MKFNFLSSVAVICTATFFPTLHASDLQPNPVAMEIGRAFSRIGAHQERMRQWNPPAIWHQQSSKIFKSDASDSVGVIAFSKEYQGLLDEMYELLTANAQFGEVESALIQFDGEVLLQAPNKPGRELAMMQAIYAKLKALDATEPIPFEFTRGERFIIGYLLRESSPSYNSDHNTYLHPFIWRLMNEEYFAQNEVVPAAISNALREDYTLRLPNNILARGNSSRATWTKFWVAFALENESDVRSLLHSRKFAGFIKRSSARSIGLIEASHFEEQLQILDLVKERLARPPLGLKRICEGALSTIKNLFGGVDRS